VLFIRALEAKEVRVHTTLVQFAKCIPLFQQIEKTLIGKGIKPEWEKIEAKEDGCGFNCGVTGKKFKLTWSIGLDSEKEDPDGCHACVSAELTLKEEGPDVVVINLTYDPAAQGWHVRQAGDLDQYATLEEKVLAMIRRPCIDDDEAFMLILLMADIFLNESAQEN
jgi:hypothetical protein